MFDDSFVGIANRILQLFVADAKEKGIKKFLLEATEMADLYMKNMDLFRCLMKWNCLNEIQQFEDTV